MQSQNLKALEALPAAQTMQQVKIPELTGGTGAGTDKQTGANRAIKERADMSQKLYELNRQLLDSDTQLTELQGINLEFQIKKQEILERNLLPREEEIALLKATAGFEAS